MSPYISRAHGPVDSLPATTAETICLVSLQMAQHLRRTAFGVVEDVGSYSLLLLSFPSDFSLAARDRRFVMTRYASGLGGNLFGLRTRLLALAPRPP